MERLAEADWRGRAAAHRARVRTWTGPHLERRRRGERHPVEDFLFTYYSLRPAQLERWHPGTAVLLEGAGPGELGRWHGPAPGGARLDVAAAVAAHRSTLRWVSGLLEATAGRTAQLGCFGLHEWAMVYRSGERRHPHPLRLGQDGTDAVVERSALRCTHADAFRFFTASARPRNAEQVGRDRQLALEQPGCLHAGMDLYKWAYKLGPLVPAELLADCFELAREIRQLDMAASPYDFADLGLEPVRVETAEGRAEYVARQRGFTARASALRLRVLTVAQGWLAAEPELDAAAAAR